MQTNTYPNRIIDIEKITQYWPTLKPGIVSGRPGQKNWETAVPFFEQISAQNCVMVLIWNLVKNRFIYAADKRNVVGHPLSLYLKKNGMSFSLSNLHPDLVTACFAMQGMGFEYFAQHKGEEVNKIIVNFDGRYKKGNGDYFHFLQQTMCIEFDHNYNPLLFLAYIHDISYLKKQQSANLIITTPEEIKMWNFNFDKQILEVISPLSAQEKKVLFYLRKGKQSKEIAKELYVSSHTIDTHRRNLLKKTNCLDTSGLVSYAKLVGLF